MGLPMWSFSENVPSPSMCAASKSGAFGFSPARAAIASPASSRSIVRSDSSSPSAPSGRFAMPLTTLPVASTSRIHCADWTPNWRRIRLLMAAVESKNVGISRSCSCRNAVDRSRLEPAATPTMSKLWSPRCAAIPLRTAAACFEAGTSGLKPKRTKRLPIRSEKASGWPSREVPWCAGSGRPAPF